jgi:hypothetical protein
MPKDVTGSIWIFDTAGQNEGEANAAESTAPNFNTRLFITMIRVDTGDGGNFLLNESNGGRRIVKLDNTPADDTLWVPINRWVAGIYVQTLPANASVEVLHGIQGRS